MLTQSKRFNKLSKEDSLVVTLYYLAENSIPEISEITGWKNSAIKVKLHRARKKLYHHLESLLEDEMKTLI